MIQNKLDFIDFHCNHSYCVALSVIWFLFPPRQIMAIFPNAFFFNKFWIKGNLVLFNRPILLSTCLTNPLKVNVNKPDCCIQDKTYLGQNVDFLFILIVELKETDHCSLETCLKTYCRNMNIWDWNFPSPKSKSQQILNKKKSLIIK